MGKDKRRREEEDKSQAADLGEVIDEDVPMQSPKKKKKKKKDKKDREQCQENTADLLQSLGAEELEEVDFCMLAIGMTRDQSSKRGWSFTAPVKLTDAFMDLASFKRYLRQQHLKQRMDDKGCHNFEVELMVIKKVNGEKRELMADSPAEFDSLRKKLITKADNYTLLVLARGIHVTSRAAAMVVVERLQRSKKKFTSPEAEEDNRYEKALRSYLDGTSTEKPSRNERQEQAYQQFCESVAKKFPSSSAISDVQILCGRCGHLARLNRRWYYGNFQKYHYELSEKCRSKGGSKGKQLTIAETYQRPSASFDIEDQCGYDSSDESDITEDIKLDDLQDAVVFLDPVSEKLYHQIMTGNMKTSHIFYKYLEKVLDFVEHAQNGTFSDFSWGGDDCTLMNFFASILHHGHASTYNLLRGPGFLSQGRKKMEFNWPDWNFPMPPPEKLRRYEGGYTTDDGVISAFALSFLKVCQSPNVTPIVDTDLVKVYPVIEADDGMALKPGLQVDIRQSKVIGINHKVDIKYIKEHMAEDPTYFKDKFSKEAHVTCVSTLDAKVSMPVAVDYIPSGLSGEDVLELRRKRTEQLQTCQSCVERCHHESAVLHHPSTCDFDICPLCIEQKTVCSACIANNHTQWNPSLRPCHQCLAAKRKCVRLISLGKASDCEEKNKKALLSAQKDFEQSTAPVTLQQQVPIPDAVHLGKNLNGSFSNWYLLYGGGRINKSILRTLSKDKKIGEKLKKVITSKALRNRDRMDTTVVTEVSSPEVRHILGKVKLVSHTVIPELFRAYESNKPGTLKHPLQMCMGPQSSILVIDYTKGLMCKGRLHYPMDVTIQMRGLENPQGLWYSTGVAFVANTGKNEILYQDLNNVSRLKVSALKKAALQEECLKRDLIHNDPQENDAKSLRDRLKKYLNSRHNGELTQVLHIDPQISAPGAMTGVPSSFNVLYVASKGTNKVYKVIIESDGNHLVGKVVGQWHIGETSGLHLQGDTLYVAMKGKDGGVLRLTTTSDVCPTQLLQNGTSECCDVSDIATSGDELYFTDVGYRQVRSYNLVSGDSAVIIGTGEASSKDGSEHTATFLQPTGLCVEENTFYVCDTAVGSVKMISPVASLVSYLEAMYTIYDCFGVHTDRDPEYHHIVVNIERVISYLKEGEALARNRHKKQGPVQGPDGVVASKTVESLQLLLKSINNVHAEASKISVDYQDKINFKALLTLVCERLFSSMRSRYEMPLVLQFAQLLGPVVVETLKSITDCGFNFYMARTSYYPIPEGCIKYQEMPHIPAPLSVACSQDEKNLMFSFQQQYGQSVRQLSVRSLTTKDKPGTLPISAYEPLKQQIDPLNLEATLENKPNDDPAPQKEQNDTSAHDILLPKGTVALVKIESEVLMVQFLEDLRYHSERATVLEFGPNHLDCLQYVSKEKQHTIFASAIHTVLDNIQYNCTGGTIDIGEDSYHGILCHINRDHDQEGEEENPTTAVEIKTKRGRSIKRPSRYVDL